MIRRALAVAGLALAAAAAAAPSSAASLDLSPYKGKVVYVDFWASWCVPCRASFPWMQEMQAAHGREGFQVVAVNVDRNKADADKFLGGVGAPNFPIVYDAKGEIASAYKVTGMPMSFVVGRDGKVRHSHSGFFPKDQGAYEAQVAKLLSEKP